MASIARYSDVEIVDGDRPAPGERVEDYQTTDTYRQVWMDGPAPATIVVSRVGDDQPTDKWVFNTDAELGDDLPREVRAAPAKHQYVPLTDRNGTAIHRFRGRRPDVRKRSITLDDVPDAVLDLLDAEDHIEVVATLGEAADA